MMLLSFALLVPGGCGTLARRINLKLTHLCCILNHSIECKCSSSVSPPRLLPLACSCGAPAKLQCPKCIELGLPRASSVFCTQDCFKAAWAKHKTFHTPPADAWLYCTKRGKARSQTMPDFAWTGTLRPDKIGPKRPIPEHIPKPDWYFDGYPAEEQASRQQSQVRRWA